MSPRRILAMLRRLLEILRTAWHNQVDVWRGREMRAWRKLIREGRVTIGPGTYGVPFVHVYGHDTTCVRIGNYCSIAEGSALMLGGQHPTDRVTTFPGRIMFGLEGVGQDGYPLPSPDTVIGSDVWIGTRSLVMSGLNIGDGAVIASGAVVTQDVPPYAIVGGVPARVIRYRFDQPTIDRLLAVRWWDWPAETVREAVPLLSAPDLGPFFEFARSVQVRLQ